MDYYPYKVIEEIDKQRVVDRFEQQAQQVGWESAREIAEKVRRLDRVEAVVGMFPTHVEAEERAAVLNRRLGYPGRWFRVERLDDGDGVVLRVGWWLR